MYTLRLDFSRVLLEAFQPRCTRFDSISQSVERRCLPPFYSLLGHPGHQPGSSARVIRQGRPGHPPGSSGSSASVIRQGHPPGSSGSSARVIRAQKQTNDHGQTVIHIRTPRLFFLLTIFLSNFTVIVKIQNPLN